MAEKNEKIYLERLKKFLRVNSMRRGGALMLTARELDSLKLQKRISVKELRNKIDEV